MKPCAGGLREGEFEDQKTEGADAPDSGHAMKSVTDLPFLNRPR